MQRTLIRDLREKIGQSVTAKGFVHVIRNQKAAQFIVLRDHTGMIQIVVERTENNRTVNELISTLNRESAVEVSGQVVSNPAIKLGQMEIQLETIKVVSVSGCPANRYIRQNRKRYRQKT
jgi:aspartyl-tRNA synthetase